MRGVLWVVGVLVLFLVAVAHPLAAYSSRASSEPLQWCGQLRSATLDVSSHSSSPRVSASWSGFGDDTGQLDFSFAIARASSSLAKHFSRSESRCVRALPNYSPDVLHWQSVPAIGSQQHQQKQQQQQQQQKQQQHFLRDHTVSLPGEVLQDSSAYVMLLRATHKTTGGVIATSAPLSVIRPVISSSDPVSCPSVARQCEELALGPRALMYSIFGPPPASFLNYLPGEPFEGNDDDDGGYSPITKAGIVIGTVVGSALLFAILLLAVCGRGGEGAFSGGMSSSGTVAVPQQGVRGNLETANQATAVERNYPSTNLDLNQRIETPAETAAAPQQGRPNIYLDSRTPSDRDYRTHM